MNKLTSSEIDKLINLIKDNPLMYKRSDKLYKDFVMKEKIWQEIAEYVGVDEHDCKTAWKSLRDQFVKTIKEMKGKSGLDATTSKKKYKYYEQLLFLKDSLQTRKRSSIYDNVVFESVGIHQDAKPQLLNISNKTSAIGASDDEKDNYDMVDPPMSTNNLSNSNTPCSSACSSPRPSKRLKDSSKEYDCMNEFLTGVLAEIKTSTSQGESDKFFLSLSAMVNKANLTSFQTRQVHRKLLNFLVDELDKIESINNNS